MKTCSKLHSCFGVDRFEGSGGRVICQKLQSFQDLDEADLKGQSGPFDVVFNCTGLGSKWLCNDSKLIPVRGQVMKVLL